MAYNKFHPAKKYKWVMIPLTLFREMLLDRRANEKDNVILITGARGDGKAQSLNSKVLTPNGWKCVGELNIGDEIFSGNGKVTKIIQLHPISKMHLYKVRTRDSRESLFNEEHL